MADYHSPTVIQPTIPNADMTPLERLLLSHIFTAVPDGEGLHFFAKNTPCDRFELPVADLRAALAESAGAASTATTQLAEYIAIIRTHNGNVPIDFTDPWWEFILQDIVRRSPAISYITVVSAFTCTNTKKRPDGFGGMVTLITANTIKRKPIIDILEDLLARAAVTLASGRLDDVADH